MSGRIALKQANLSISGNGIMSAFCWNFVHLLVYKLREMMDDGSVFVKATEDNKNAPYSELSPVGYVVVQYLCRQIPLSFLVEESWQSTYWQQSDLEKLFKVGEEVLAIFVHPDR